MIHSRHPVLAPLHCLMLFAQWIKVRRMIEEIAVEPKQTFWIMTINLIADAAAIEWSKVFGSWDEDTHWTKVVPKDQHEVMRIALLKCINLNQSEWEAYRVSIVEYRNQLVAHHDLDAAVTKYPHYDKALEAAYFMFDQLRRFAEDEELGGIPSSLDGWSKTVAGNMSAIVRAAFTASATLGSNVRGGG